MPGYERLDGEETELLFRQRLQPELTLSSTKKIKPYNPLEFYWDKENKLIIISTPIRSKDLRKCVEFLDKKVDYNEVLLPVLGTAHGVTAQHTATCYINKLTQQIHYFDPKISDPQRFLSENNGGFRAFFGGILRSLNPFSSKSPCTVGDYNGHYYGLGTQSFFDNVSSGYHNIANILVCRELIRTKQEVNPKNLLSALKKPTKQAKSFQKQYKKKFNCKFSDFIEQAILDTVMPLETKARQRQLNLTAYFLGWPEKENFSKKVLYVLTAGFPIIMLLNMIRHPFELIPNALAEAGNYIKNKLIGRLPTNLASQYLRSGLMFAALAFQGLSKGIYLALRFVTSPMANIHAIQTINNLFIRNALIGLSALTSAAAYASIAFFAAPALLTLFPGLVPSIAPVISALAYPAVELFALAGLKVASITAALLTLGTGVNLYFDLKAGIELFVDKTGIGRCLDKIGAGIGRCIENVKEQCKSLQDDDPRGSGDTEIFSRGLLNRESRLNRFTTSEAELAPSPSQETDHRQALLPDTVRFRHN